MELLIVLAIITLLVAILVPVFWNARNSARKTTCVSHLQQLGKSALMYADEWDETLPDAPGSAFANSVDFNQLPWASNQLQSSAQLRAIMRPSQSSYLHDVMLLTDRTLKPELFDCPNDVGARDPSVQQLGFGNGPVTQYALTSYMWDPSQMMQNTGLTPSGPLPSVNGKALSDLENPSEARLIQDYGVFWHTTISASSQEKQGLVNVAFADGHVRQRSTLVQTGSAATNSSTQAASTSPAPDYSAASHLRK